MGYRDILAKKERQMRSLTRMALLLMLAVAVIFAVVNAFAAGTDAQKQAGKMDEWIKSDVGGTCPKCYDTFILPTLRTGPGDTIITCPSCRYEAPRSEFIKELEKRKKADIDR
jgi:hypothetical protein